jgi:UDP-N-acetyl-2-amino-2-deoxyglucuronate dehydrogenase
MPNFAMTGVAGFVAARHLKAIKDIGANLLAACDPNDSVGILDKYFFETRFFREFERFDRHVEKLRRRGDAERVHYVSICSPNYLHDAHVRFALRVGAHAICEKPLVINPWNLDTLAELEEEHGRRIYTILQLRVHPALVKLRERLQAEPAARKHEVTLAYITSRGNWYLSSWKGDLERSGGLATNIGIHFFDLLLWLFGSVQGVEVHVSDPRKAAGYLELERAQVRWYLSIDRQDLPFDAVPGGPTTYRSIRVDGQEVEFSEGFTDLHTVLYREILAGRGFGIEDARPSISLSHAIRTARPTGPTARSHQMLAKQA